jgi:hypothetical protein
MAAASYGRHHRLMFGANKARTEDPWLSGSITEGLQSGCFTNIVTMSGHAMSHSMRSMSMSKTPG